MNKSSTTSSRYLFLLFVISVLVAGFNSLDAQNPRQVNTRDHSVLINVDVETDPPKIILNWAPNELAVGYEIRKKSPEDGGFPQNALAQLDSLTFTWEDTDVEIGTAYEYEVRAISYGSIIMTFQGTEGNFDSTVARPFWGFGYAYAGIEMSATGIYGKVILLVDSTIAEALPDEVARLEDDLLAEGWNIVRFDVARSEEFDGDQVKFNKNLIMQEYNKDPDNVNTVLILGRVAVPYSGIMNPDGHGNHIGAWPADLYYGHLEDLIWTDNQTSQYNGSASRDQNKNSAGDGKFDVTRFNYGDVELAVGRIDFYDMPAFESTEIELIKKYLDKNHSYRTGDMDPVYRGLVDDNFGAKKYYEGFGSSGWRNIGTLVGSDSVKKLDWFTKLGTDNYLWAYGCGGGTYRSAGGIGNTDDFAANQVNGVFTMLFGSYFGDWDSQNNFLRASLCSEPSILTCAWAGRPQWYFQHMAMGFPIGYSTTLSQNNTATYMPNVIFFNGPLAQGQLYTIGNRYVHTALMGDPTLRMYMAMVPEARNLSVVQPFGKRHIEINWDAPDDGEGYMYNLYRANRDDGQEYSDDRNMPFELVNTDGPLTETTYIDSTLYDGSVHYMVRTIKLQISNTGTFYNNSRGGFQSGIVSGVGDDLITKLDLTCSPNPATTNAGISVSIDIPSAARVDVFNSRGQLVKSIADLKLAGGIHGFSWDLRNDLGIRLPAGIYYLRLKTATGSRTCPISILP